MSKAELVAKTAVEVEENLSTYDTAYMEETIPMDELFSSQTSGALFYTFDFSDSKEDKLKMHKIKNNPAHRINDCLGQEIECIGFMSHWVKTVNPETKKEEVAPRIILIDKNWESYVAVSVGALNALKMICEDLWIPTEADPIILKARKEKGKRGFEFTTFEVVGF